jgi:hypothetical protein
MSSFILNITFDCADPHALAEFWAAATGYTILSERDDHVALHAPDERGVRKLIFYRVPEPKSVKNRVHIDLASRDPQAEIARLIELGATKVEYHEDEEAGWKWTVMLDPEGNEFCIG